MMAYRLIHDGILDNPVLRGTGRRRKIYSDTEGFIWMIMEARRKAGSVTINGLPATLEIGQLSHSFRFMAEKFGWSLGRIQAFVRKLETNTMVNTGKVNGQLLLTICKFTDFQQISEPAESGSNTASDTLPIHSQYKDQQVIRKKESKRASLSRREREESGHIDIEEYLAEHPAPEPEAAPLSDPAFSGDPEPEPKPKATPANCNGNVVALPDPRPQKIAEEMRAVWNQTCGDQTSMCRVISEKRKTKMVRTFRTLFGNDIERWRQLCQRVAGSPFLCGEGGRGWKADLMWCLEGDHALEIMEGKYDGQSHDAASRNSHSGQPRGQNALVDVIARRAARRHNAQEDLLRR